jgi:IS30 family transposase
VDGTEAGACPFDGQTVSREIQRNGGREGYSISAADEAAWDRALPPKDCKLVKHRALARWVAGKLRLQWSPEEIAGWLRREHPEDMSRQVSHETIYKTLFIQARGALKKELLAHLRQTRTMRHPRGHTLKGKKQGQIVDADPRALGRGRRSRRAGPLGGGSADGHASEPDRHFGGTSHPLL